MKASSKVLTVLQTKNRPIATTAFEGMKKKTDMDGNITSFPVIEAICDAFSIIMECVDRSEVSSGPTMHVAFPMLFKAIKDLDSVAGGATVWRKRSLHMVQPSIYSKLICRNLGQHLQDTLKPHPLLLVGCYLNPLFRGIEFVSDEKTRN